MDVRVKTKQRKQMQKHRDGHYPSTTSSAPVPNDPPVGWFLNLSVPASAQQRAQTQDSNIYQFQKTHFWGLVEIQAFPLIKEKKQCVVQFG